ncbi:hypothetical protein P7K49_011382 [Saguinus oedipus]|uniref:Uncharacterized protein n=1 Tax=Saguinus oedipus TaxID=9490 RepID=A0ABQ9VR59_SAGOE|nr:hypothetical protein P7K49_011382 [Saguinus oedipus]
MNVGATEKKRMETSRVAVGEPGDRDKTLSGQEKYISKTELNQGYARPGLGSKPPSCGGPIGVAWGLTLNEMTCRKMTLEHTLQVRVSVIGGPIASPLKKVAHFYTNYFYSIMSGEAVSGLRGKAVASVATFLFPELENQVWDSPLTLLLAINAAINKR